MANSKRLVSLGLFACFFLLLGCGAKEKRATLKIGATSVPHAEILEVIAPKMREAGYPIEIIVIDDYSLPNRMLAEKEIDANFFQHASFLEEEKAQFGYPLVSLGAVHYEPLGIYSLCHASIECQEGMRFAIPSDPSNEKRALLLLQDLNLIKVKEGGDSPVDLIENPHYLCFSEVDAALLAHVLKDVDYAVIPGNFALQAGYNPSNDALYLERKALYPNVVAVRQGEENKEIFKVLMNSLHDSSVSLFIENKYKGALCVYR